MKKTKKPVRSLKKKILVVAGLALIVVGVGVLAARGYQDAVNAGRLARIRAIYAGLNVPYVPTSSYVFGEKQPYGTSPDQRGRTFSSSQTYETGKSVADTVEEFRSAIEKEGFRYIGEPYPGSMYVQLHFKSDKGEYVRLTVSSKLRDDAFRNASLLKQDYKTLGDLDPDAAPSNVLVKVNLDDNNE